MERWRHSLGGFECAYCAAILEEFENDVCTRCLEEQNGTSQNLRDQDRQKDQEELW